MKRFLLFLILLIVIAGCVQIPEDEPAEPADEAEAVLEPEPTPLAPLPEVEDEVLVEEKEDEKMSTTTGPATVPKAVTAPTQNQTTSSAPTTQSTQQSQYAWTTESLSIAEGEKKYIYIKE